MVGVNLAGAGIAESFDRTTHDSIVPFVSRVRSPNLYRLGLNAGLIGEIEGRTGWKFMKMDDCCSEMVYTISIFTSRCLLLGSNTAIAASRAV